MWGLDRNPEATVKEGTWWGGQQRHRETRLVGEKVWLQRYGRDRVRSGWFAGSLVLVTGVTRQMVRQLAGV